MVEAALIDGQVAGIIARELAVHADLVLPQASLRGDLNADSLDVICVVVAIEDEVGVVISDAQTASLYDGTVGDIQRLVAKVASRWSAFATGPSAMRPAPGPTAMSA